MLGGHEEELPDGSIHSAVPPEDVPSGRRCATWRFGKDEALKADAAKFATA